MLLGLLGKKVYNTRFIARNMAGASAIEIAAIRKVNRKYLDWKWEYAEDILYFVCACLFYFQKYWSAPVYQGSELSPEDIAHLDNVASDGARKGFTLVTQVMCYALWHGAMDLWESHRYGA